MLLVVASRVALVDGFDGVQMMSVFRLKTKRSRPLGSTSNGTH